MRAVWDFLSSPDNRAVLAWLGGGLALLASGLWTVIKYYRPAQRPSKPDTTSGQANADDAPSLGAGRGILIGDVLLPRHALWLAALGMVLLFLALLLLDRGDSVVNSVKAGRDIEGSTITITPAPPD